MSPRNVEILAPAGSPEAFRAALASGADAVYLGLKSFNARGNAINFTTEELAHYVPEAHAHGTKVYLTLNTLVKMNERAPLLEDLARAADCGIDGVILQDIGLGRIIARYFPQLRRHASTQMAIHNREGVQFCVDEGFERVVLARELTLEEIRGIRDAFPPSVIQLEVFCHGAMCYTYSGMCFFSGSVGGRSGNRGECAYTCRKGYKILNKTTFPMAAPKDSYLNYLFSMKDMNTLDILPQLLAAGVDSLKIEGRRKGPAYVSASVQAYRERLAENPNPELEEDLRLAFARSYTRAFYERGQFGDAPIDLTATGSQGIPIGVIDENGWFTLQKPGLQRYDGLRLVRPDRTEELISFRDYRVSTGDRFKPEPGVAIQLHGNYPPGTRVMWVHAQAVEQRYKPEKERITATEESAGQVDFLIDYQDLHVRILARSAYGQAQRSFDFEASATGKNIPLRETLFRFGDTPFREGRWQGPETLPGFYPASQLKKLRRELLAELLDRSGSGRTQTLESLITEANQSTPVAPQKAVKPVFHLRVDRLDLLEAVLEISAEHPFGIDFVPRSTHSTPEWHKITNLLQRYQGEVRLALPMVLRHWDLRLLRRRLADMTWLQDVELSNPGHFPLVRETLPAQVRKHADFSLYHLNTWAWHALNDLGVNGRFTLSLEDDKPNMADLLSQVDPGRFEVIAYTDTPLFVAEACSLAALYGGCPGAKVCKHETLFIENEHGDAFQVRHDRCRSTVIGENALSWSGHLGWFRERGVYHLRADFTTRPYQAKDVARILDALLHDKPLAGTHTENLERILL